MVTEVLEEAMEVLVQTLLLIGVRDWLKRNYSISVGVSQRGAGETSTFPCRILSDLDRGETPIPCKFMKVVSSPPKAPQMCMSDLYDVKTKVPVRSKSIKFAC